VSVIRSYLSITLTVNLSLIATLLEPFWPENKNIVKDRNVDFKEFLVNEHENAYDKYSDILKKVINVLS